MSRITPLYTARPMIRPTILNSAAPSIALKLNQKFWVSWSRVNMPKFCKEASVLRASTLDSGSYPFRCLIAQHYSNGQYLGSIGGKKQELVLQAMHSLVCSTRQQVFCRVLAMLASSCLEAKLLQKKSFMDISHN